MKFALAPALLAASLAWGHPQGFHKKLVFTLTRTELQALLVMDVDGGDRCALIRAGADQNHDGVLSPEETGALKKRLVAMATKSLSVAFSGARVAMVPRESKINLHQDPRVSESGLSVALVFDVRHNTPLSPGMALEVEDTAPDLSTVNLQVFQVPAGDAGIDQPFDADIASGQKTSIRLGVLAEHR